MKKQPKLSELEQRVYDIFVDYKKENGVYPTHSIASKLLLRGDSPGYAGSIISRIRKKGLWLDDYNPDRYAHLRNKFNSKK